MEQRGWSASETARRVSQFLDDRDKFSRAHVWQYLRGNALPRTRYLHALCRALELQPQDLLPNSIAMADPLHGGEQGRSAAQLDMVHVRDIGEGTALLQVSQRVPWATAIEVLRLLKR